MFTRTRRLAALTTVVALSSIAVASAAARTDGTTATRPAGAKTMSMSKAKGSGTTRPVRLGGGGTVVAITAFPTGGKGSGTEATCGLWADRLAEDEATLDQATDKQDIIDASHNLDEDVDNALDAGCVVIYSAASPQLEQIKTVSVARAQTGGGFVKSTWTAGPSVAYISAFPTGGKGSGTEATCALWSERLQDDQQIIDNAPDTDKQDASGPLEEDIDNALDAGCVVIY